MSFTSSALSQRLNAKVKRLFLFDIPIDHVPELSFISIIDRMVESRKPLHIVFLRSWDFVRARRDPSFRKILHDAALVLPVSKLISSSFKKVHGLEPQRYYPYDTIIKILMHLEDSNGSYFILGGKKKTYSVILDNLQHTFPKLRLLGRYPGYFKRIWESRVMAAITKANPNLLLVGDGLKGRMKWIGRRKDRLNHGLQIWSSETFNIFGLKRKRPNRVSIKNGREYIYESMNHPFRVFRIVHYMAFRFSVLWYRVTR